MLFTDSHRCQSMSWLISGRYMLPRKSVSNETARLRQPSANDEPNISNSLKLPSSRMKKLLRACSKVDSRYKLDRGVQLLCSHRKEMLMNRWSPCCSNPLVGNSGACKFLHWTVVLRSHISGALAPYDFCRELSPVQNNITSLSHIFETLTVTMNFC